MLEKIQFLRSFFRSPMARMASLPNTKKGRELFEKLGSPKTVVAPMVDQSELAWRQLCRKYGAEICYSPMYHARLFGTMENYRTKFLCEQDGDNDVGDRPLVIQFCANDPQEFVAAAKLVVGKCDAVDLNLGCPQGIARKGHYGSFLMEEWDLVASLIRAVSTEVPELPITAKIRVFEDRNKTLEYAKRILEAGAVWLTVHGRTREMKGQITGLADWSQIKFLRDNLPEETVIIANGNIIYRHNIDECLKATGCDAVMTAETALCNPAVFAPRIDGSELEDEFPRVDKVLREYFEISKKTPGQASAVSMKTHMFKLLRNFFAKETDLRNQLGPTRTGDFDRFESIVKQVEQRVDELIAKGPDVIEKSSANDSYYTVPHWRTQPLFRIVDGVASNGIVHDEEKAKAQQHAKIVAEAKERKKRNLEETDPDSKSETTQVPTDVDATEAKRTKIAQN